MQVCGLLHAWFRQRRLNILVARGGQEVVTLSEKHPSPKLPLVTIGHAIRNAEVLHRWAECNTCLRQPRPTSCCVVCPTSACHMPHVAMQPHLRCHASTCKNVSECRLMTTSADVRDIRPYVISKSNPTRTSQEGLQRWCWCAGAAGGSGGSNGSGFGVRGGVVVMVVVVMWWQWRWQWQQCRWPMWGGGGGNGGNGSNGGNGGGGGGGGRSGVVVVAAVAVALTAGPRKR